MHPINSASIPHSCEGKGAIFVDVMAVFAAGGVDRCTSIDDLPKEKIWCNGLEKLAGTGLLFFSRTSRFDPALASCIRHICVADSTHFTDCWKLLHEVYAACAKGATDRMKYYIKRGDITALEDLINRRLVLRKEGGETVEENEETSWQIAKADG